MLVRLSKVLGSIDNSCEQMNPIEPRKREETLDDILEHDSYPRKKPRLRVPEATAIVDTTPMTVSCIDWLSVVTQLKSKLAVHIPINGSPGGEEDYRQSSG